MTVNWAEVLKAAAPIATGIARTGAANRTEQNATNIITSRDAEQAAIDRARLGLDRDRLGLDQTQDARVAETDAVRKALQASLIKNTQDASFSRDGFRSPVANISFSGGARPSALGAQGQEIADLLYNKSLTSLMNGGAPKGPSSEAVPRGSGSGVPEYQPAETKTGGSFWENALGIAGLGANALPSILSAFGGPSATDVAAKAGAAMKGAGGSVSAAKIFGAGPPSASSSLLAGTPGVSGAELFGTAPTDGVVRSLSGGPAGPSMWGGVNKFAGPAAMGIGLAAPLLPAGSARTAADWASKGAQIGSFVPGVGTAIGAGIGAVAGAIRGHQNNTKEAREDFAKKNGYRSLHDLNLALDAFGPAGQELKDRGLHVIGKHDDKGNQLWLQQVAQLLGSRR